MLLPSNLVGIEHGTFQAVVRGAANRSIELEENEFVRLVHVAYSKEDALLSLEALKPGREILILRIDGYR